MTPGAYRALAGASVFMLQLPAGLSGQGNPGLSRPRSGKPLRKERRQQNLESAPDRRWRRGAGILAGKRRCLVPRACGRENWAARAWHMFTRPHCKMLGSEQRSDAVRKAHGGRSGGRTVPAPQGPARALLPTGFDGLCWGIIGQQINVKFAGSLRREIIHLGGEREEAAMMRAHPIAGARGRYQRGPVDQAPLFPLQGGISDRARRGKSPRAGWTSKI